MENIANYFYLQWYEKDVSPHLTNEEKNMLMYKISELTLREPIWLDKEKNWISIFPELKQFSHSGSISGLQLCAVMEGCLKDLQKE